MDKVFSILKHLEGPDCNVALGKSITIYRELATGEAH
jgi:hypothetical protein